jgi:HEAT repeat protein
MRRFGPSLAAFTLVVSAANFASDALAHGGGYRGPPGEVPPNTREPSDPPPPPDGMPPQTPGGNPSGGPTTGGGNPSGPGTPGGDGGAGTGGGTSGPPPATGGNPPGGPRTGGARGPGSSKAPGYASWAFWWGFNKDEILGLKSKVRAGFNPVTGGSFGTRSAASVRAVTDEAIAHSIVPTLRTLLADEKQSFHVRSAAELGLAKIGDADSVDTLRKLAANEQHALHREIEETAALALGVMQRDDPQTRAFLLGIVSDQARSASHARPFAAISLGLLGAANDRERAVVSALVAAVANREAGADVKPACLTGLGLLGDESAVPALLAMVRDGKAPLKGAVELTQIETAYAVAALGKLGRPGTAAPGEETCVLDELVRIVERHDDKGVTDVRRSAVIALGQIGPQCTAKQQKRVVETLKRVLEANVEEQQRAYALTSLARVGAARGVDPVLRRDLVAAIGEVMEKGQGQAPAFAAMALGLVGRAVADEGGTPEDDIRAPLRKRFAQRSDAQIRGSFALASGLAKDKLAAPALLAALSDAGEDKRIRGWCALALGLMDERSAVPAIRATLQAESDRDLRVQVAMAAGLIGDGTVIDDLTNVIRNADSSNYELGSAALALGQIGDERAVKALLEVATDAKHNYGDVTRGLAVVALGQIGDRRDLPVLSRVATDVNYRAHVPAITELLTIL